MENKLNHRLNLLKRKKPNQIQFEKNTQSCQFFGNFDTVNLSSGCCAELLLSESHLSVVPFMQTVVRVKVRGPQPVSRRGECLQ